ncbi:MAG: OB-fold domain-containing protein [Sphingomonadales bacterium]
MSEQPVKHFPIPTPETAPYWEACRKHQLLIQRCLGCGEHQFYPRSICGHCLSGKIEWVVASGRGEVVSYTVMNRPVSKAYDDEDSRVLAIIQLAEGPRMMSNLVQCEPGELAIGLEVEVIFEDWSDEISIPKFRPAR